MKKTVFADGSWIEELEDGSVAIHDDGCTGTVGCLQERSGKISYGQPAPAPPPDSGTEKVNGSKR